MLTQRLPVKENACNFNEGSPPSIVSNNIVDQVLVSMPSCEVTSDDFSEGFVAVDNSGANDLIVAFSSISLVESSGQSEDVGKENVRVHDGLEVRGSDTICALPRRVSSRSKSSLKAGTKRAGQRCKKSRKSFLDFTLLTVTKKRRSCLNNRVRSCPWGFGFMGKVNQAFLKSNELGFNFKRPIKLPRPRSDGVKREGINKQVAQNSQTQKETNCVSTGRIRLKVKFGREVSQHSVKDVTPITESNDESYLRTEVGTLATEMKNDLEKEFPRSVGLQGHNGNLEDAPLSNYAAGGMHLSNKDTSQKLARKIEDSYHEIRALPDVERLGITLDSRCLDPGTSPDSEVINVTPETPMSVIVLETKRDVLDSSMLCAPHTDVANVKTRQRSKKGKKKGKFYKAGDCSVEGCLPSSEFMDKATVTEKYEHGEKVADGSHSSDSIFGTILNASSNAVISEEFTGEQKLFSTATDAGVSCEPFVVDKVAEVDSCFGSDVLLKSAKSEISDKMDSFLNSTGKKLPKSARARGVRKSTSEGPDSSGRRRNACRQKGNGSKSGSSCKAKGKDDGNLDVCKVDRKTRKGDHTIDDLGEIKTGERGAARDASNSYLVPNEAGKQHLLPRNAWVSCDDCHKWRRITAELADHIEETNCKWICKENLYKDFADCLIPQEKSNAEINAELEISDASCEEDAGDARVNSRNSGLKHLSVAQHTWMLISSNVFLNRSRKNQNIDEIMVCHCKPPSDGRMGCGDGCLNRMLNIECDRETCPCGDLCSNQQFQKRKYAQLQPFRCGKKGYGLQLLEDIPKGQFLIEYVGEVLDMHAYEARQREYALNGHKHFYFMTLNGSEVIDACAKGNLGRFINHSCDPNCQTEKWMVNGEVCIGLFALRDIKKGEEVTFDYNFVRVFGAAVKKCVCGASQCRGYIGGDPSNSEVIVQVDSDDEYPEPVMINEDGEINNNLENTLSVTSTFHGTCLETTVNQPKNQDNMDERDASFGCLETKTELEAAEILLEEVGLDNPSTEDSMNNVTSSTSKMEVSLETEGSMEQLPSFIEPTEPSLRPAVVSSKSVSSSEQVLQLKEVTMNDSVCSTQKSEACSQTTMFGNSLPDLTEIKRKSKSETQENGDMFQKPSLLKKSSSSSSSVKKGKSRTKVSNVRKPLETENKSHVLPCKFKKPLEGSSNGRFEEVEEKLGELLDKDGGINRRKDASRGYLKLLLLTAASGDSIHGETIQRTRDLSMILDALLKTKSRTILIDIINKNGLQMLHNIMKRCRREFNKIPVLRKLLKVLEYLAVRQILNQEQINGGPQRPGIESFRESILRLTEHVDKQVHQIARSFRDQWIPRHLRKINWMGRDDDWIELERGSNCGRLSAWSDQAVRSTETIDNVKQPVLATAPDETCTANSCSASGSMGGCLITGTKTRKRKSRWDQPAETTPDPRSPQLEEPGTDDGRPNINEDFPPGFSTPCNGSLFLYGPSPCVNHSHQENVVRANSPCQMVIAHPQGRFVSRLPVSYGIPVSIVQQFGVPEAETVNWVVAPGMPFHPFPPLPLYPRDRKDTKNSAANLTTMRQPAERLERDGRNFPYRSDQNPVSTLGTGPSNIEMLDTSNRNNFQRGRSFSGGLGRKYFKQQKWNHSKLAPPWVRNRNGWGSLNNSLRNGMCNTGLENGINEFKVPYSSEGARTSVESPGYPFY